MTDDEREIDVRRDPRYFGPRRVNWRGVPDEQWRYGANKLVDMVCRTVDELTWEFDEEEEEFAVHYDTYDMERREDQLWKALWVLERDVRVEHGSAFGQEHKHTRDSEWT